MLAAPSRWIAQDLVKLSTHPTLVGGELEPRNVDLRAFVVLSRDPEPGVAPHAEVLPAPLTRVAPVRKHDRQFLARRRGERHLAGAMSRRAQSARNQAVIGVSDAE